MKVLSMVFFLLCSAWCSDASALGDYNINVHVSATRMVRYGQNAAHQSLIATIDGKKCELESLDMPNALLMLGDYKEVKDQHWAGPYDSYRVYEFFFPDNKKRQYLVVGQSE